MLMVDYGGGGGWVLNTIDDGGVKIAKILIT